MAGSWPTLLMGFPVLVVGAWTLVRGASTLGLALGLSEFVVGMTIVGMGTSAPELVVSVSAALAGAPDIAVGNVVGSNLCNILLILGLSACIRPLDLHTSIRSREVPFALLTTAVLAVLANDALVDGAAASWVTRGDGLVLLAFFGVYLYYTLAPAASTPKEREEAAETPGRLGVGMALVLTVVGFGLLVVGGGWVADGAAAVAVGLGVSQAVVGLTIVAVGTSLPELATSVVAAWQNKGDIAVGNVIGSNIFNVCAILGVTAVLEPAPYVSAMNVDVALVGLATLALALCTATFRRHVLDRREGAVFVAAGVAYYAFQALRA